MIFSNHVLKIISPNYPLTNANTETTRYPLLPSMSKPAVLLFESFLAAVGSEAFANATDVMNAIRKHRKVNAQAAQIGVDTLNSVMVGSSGCLPQRIVATQPPTKIVKKKSTKASKSKAKA